MGFTRKIKYFLVHGLGHTNKAAQALLQAGAVQVSGKTMSENLPLDDFSEIKVSGAVVRAQTPRRYIRFYKPRGYESTLSAKVPGNLAAFFESPEQLAIAGRLDMDSEGLLLLSNDGTWIEELCHPDREKEKEYLVQLDQAPHEVFTARFAAGVQIGGHFTKPCSCVAEEDHTIRVILTEGKNRQIRRMCHKLGYGVLRLKRIRIGNVELGALKPGEQESFSII